MVTHLVYSAQFHRHNTQGHPENAKRLSLMLDALQQSSLHEFVQMVQPSMLDENILYAVHSKEMLNHLKETSKQGDIWIDLDTYVSSGDYDTCRLAAGGLLDACYAVLQGRADNAFGLIRPPGHHATGRRSMGFCLVNNAALAAHALAQQGYKVLVFDSDVHHGNGIQDIFYHRHDVLYQSLHLSPHFPGTGAVEECGVEKGAGFTNNAPMSYGNGVLVATQVLEEVFLPIARQFNPDIVIVSTGFDSHHSDLLGGLRFTIDFFGTMIQLYQEIQPKMVCALEGGYSLDWLGRCFLSQIGQLTRHPLHFPDVIREDTDGTVLLRELKETLGAYWKL